MARTTASGITVWYVSGHPVPGRRCSRPPTRPSEAPAANIRRTIPCGLADPGRGEHLRDHREGEREHPHPEALERPDADQDVDLIRPRYPERRADVRREPGEADRDRVEGHHEDQHPLLAVLVAELPEDRGGHGPDEQVGRDDPDDGRGRGVVEEEDEGPEGGQDHRLDVGDHQRHDREHHQHRPGGARVVGRPSGGQRGGPAAHGCLPVDRNRTATVLSTRDVVARSSSGRSRWRPGFAGRDGPRWRPRHAAPWA